MQQWHGWLMATIVSVALAGATARADEEKEEKVPLDKVPKAVLKAVKSKFKDAKVVGVEKENENGKLRYEIKLARKGQKIEAKVTRKGKIVLIEKTIFAKKSKEEGEDDEDDEKEGKKSKKKEVKKGKKNKHEDEDDDEKEGKKREVKKSKKKHEEEDEDDEKEVKKGKHKKSKKGEKDKD